MIVEKRDITPTWTVLLVMQQETLLDCSSSNSSNSMIDNSQLDCSDCKKERYNIHLDCSDCRKERYNTHLDCSDCRKERYTVTSTWTVLLVMQCGATPTPSGLDLQQGED